NAPDITGKYTFTISGSEGAPMPERTEATNDAAGNVSFGEIAFTMENVFGSEVHAASDDPDPLTAGRTKTFTYEVTESGAVEGVKNDAEPTKTFTITVTDNGDGTISVSKSTEGSFDFAFTNVYSVDPTDPTSPTDSAVKITKELSGRKMDEGEFSFQMKDSSGTVVSEAVNDADGAVVFAPIVFDEPGTFAYTISEVRGDLGGVQYDASTYIAFASVIDNGKGGLEVSWSVMSEAGDQVDQAVFHNTYVAQPTKVSFAALKTLDGRELADGEFSFELRNAQGELVQTVKNGADGSIAFDTIDFKKAGTYTYTISEVAGDAEGITYDSTEHVVKLVVEDDGKGQMVVKDLTYDGAEAAPVFRNEYKEPAKPVIPTPIPQTGDNSLLPIAGGLAAGALCIVAGVILKKRAINR
ncbi:MAG: FctA domain-containing protein, partial [Collinsella sp.]|nr:FctA domain-containing protein [Collinsella sp.]